MKYTSGELAQHVGVNVETIRYYERRGLLTATSRRNSGYRVFTDNDVSRMKFIRGAKSLGYTLTEIAGLLDLMNAPETRCIQMKEMAVQKVTKIDKKLAELKAMKRQLQALIKTDCEESAHPATCSKRPANVGVPLV